MATNEELMYNFKIELAWFPGFSRYILIDTTPKPLTLKQKCVLLILQDRGVL